MIFVDSDDTFTEDFVSVYYKKIYENKTDIEFFSFNEKKSQKNMLTILNLIMEMYLIQMNY